MSRDVGYQVMNGPRADIAKAALMTIPTLRRR
jgi:hypothetical protein